MNTLFLADNPTFGTRHVIVLLISVAFIVFSVLFIARKKLSLSTVNKLLLLIGIISESIKVIYYIISNEAEYNGYLPKTDLPFHLCSIQILFVVILNLTKNENVKKALYSFMLPTCLLGGFFALLLPTSSARNQIIVTIQYFLFHSSIIVFAINLLITKEIKFTVKDYRNSLIILFAFFFIAIYLNSWINDYEHAINFMYVVAPPQDGLPFLNKDHGWAVYMAHYAITAITCVTLCYIAPIINAIKTKKKK